MVVLVSFVFFVSSLFSNLYFESPLYYFLTDRKFNKISAIALGYIFASFLIYVQPLKNINLEGQLISPIVMDKNLVSILAIIIGIMSIIPFIENLNVVLSKSFLDFADAYQLKQSESVDVRSHLSTIGRFCNGIINWFRYITPVLFFWSIAERKSKWIIIASSFAFLNPICLSLISGGRGALYGAMMTIVFNFLLFKKSFPKNVLQRIKIIGVVLIALFSIMLFIMTFDRADGDQSLATQQIYRYVGEGFVNFSETGWYVEKNTNGHSIINGTGFTFFRYLSDFFLSRDFSRLGNVTGFRMYVYYTVFGDFFIDFGFVGGLLFNALLSLCFFFVVCSNPMSFSSLILINMYAKIALTGYGCFCYMNYAEFVLFTFLFCSVCRLFEPKSKIA